MPAVKRLLTLVRGQVDVDRPRRVLDAEGRSVEAVAMAGDLAALRSRSTAGRRLREYEICFVHATSSDEPLAVGEAIRWDGPEVWRVETVHRNRVTTRLWPDEETYPMRIRDYGPGAWPAKTQP
jgi:hypothetical protein